ncbi:hypothetical protein ACLRGF_10650 [Mycetocola zhadangensis]|uniref:hypothetical protein n=1 Tax=Mycetocola zhadangensis TaxID=1164595 RepID=UPI003A4D88F9
MARQSRLLIILLIPMVLGLLMGGPAAVAAECDVGDKLGGFCSDAGLENGEAVIRGDQDNGGGGGNNGGGNEGGDNRDGGDSDGSDGPGGIDRNLNCSSGALCLPELVTLSDLARFRPSAPALTMEPDGWLLIGLPANFIADTSQHTQGGTLFDVPIEVRFTPSGYNWSWGDGSSSRTTVPGATWAELGLPEFSTTPTSHVFAETGIYSVTVTVAFTVEYRAVGGSWISIAGTLSAPAVTIAALAGDAKTVLVDKECTRNPSGPGC